MKELRIQFFRGLFILLIICCGCQLTAQNTQIERDSINQKRLNISLIGAGSIMVGSYTSLYFLWYADYPQSKFHWINDNHEWLQMDKFGHATTTYHLSRFTYDVLRWSGVNNNQSAIYAGLAGFAGISLIEVFDGFSYGWGASSGDLLANFSGSTLFTFQQLLWKEQRLGLKYSFHRTDFPFYNPYMLGENFVQELLKDYNGQTIWLTANISTFLPDESRFPKWINVAFGYGADGMLGANGNLNVINEEPLPNFERKREFYLSLDIDLKRIPVRKKGLRTFLSILNIVKVPMPAIEIDQNGKVRFWPLYF
jgi:hypothetical protein